MTIIIDISPAGTTLWQAEIDGEVIGNSHTPMLTTARILMARGVSPETPLAMRRKGSEQIDMTGTVGGCARLTVEETKYGPRFRGWEPFSAQGVRP